MIVTKRQKETLDYIDYLNRNTKANQGITLDQYTHGPLGFRVQMLDMRVVRPLVRKGLVVLVYPDDRLDCGFYPVLTAEGECIMWKLFTSPF